MPPNPALFWRKIGQNLALSSRKWHKKNLIGENGGERKINPSANPVYCKLVTSCKTGFDHIFCLQILDMCAAPGWMSAQISEQLYTDTSKQPGNIGLHK